MNNDGYPELCSAVWVGSEICDEHIEVYEIKNDKKYGLADLLKSTYNLFTEKDELLVKKRPYMDYDSDI